MKTFQLEEDSVAFKLLEYMYMKKYSNEFLQLKIGNLSSRQNEAITQRMHIMTKEYNDKE